MIDGMDTGRLTMEARRKLTLTGATEVVRFDEELVELNSALGRVLIEGRELKLKCLSLDTGKFPPSPIRSPVKGGGCAVEAGAGGGQAPGLCTLRVAAGPGGRLSAPPGTAAPPADPDGDLPGADGLLAFCPLWHLPGGPAAGLLSGDDGGLCPVGSPFRQDDGGVLRRFLAFCGTSPENNPKNFSQISKFPLCKTEKMEYNTV